MMLRTVIATGLILMSFASYADDARPASADDFHSLGRVFTTPAERRLLDQKRSLLPAADTGGTEQTGASIQTAKKALNPAGYIILPGGIVSKWIDGDFREVHGNDGVGVLRFPGGITIIKHVADTGGEAQRTDPDNSNDVSPDAAQQNSQGRRP